MMLKPVISYIVDVSTDSMYDFREHYVPDANRPEDVTKQITHERVRIPPGCYMSWYSHLNQ